jgi:lipid II:glycine glycyltransferase (peptidoglycan interpeptide bridge formation enzyme)
LKPLDLISLPLVKKDNLPVAAGFILNFKNTYYLEYTASDRTKLNLYPNHKLFWEVIKLAQNNGASIVDWGRTSVDNESLIIFKEKWNTRKNSVYNFVYPARGKIKREQGALNKYLMKVNRALPVSLLKIEGKIIYPHLG